MFTFANVFAMQLGQILYYNGLSYACSNTSCTDNITSNSARINYDGHIFQADKNAKQISVGTVKGTCEGLKPSMSYITKIADGLTKSASSTSGSSTSIISSSKTAICSTLSTLKTACSGDSSCETACTASDC